MAANLKTSNTVVNAEANATAALANSGYLRIYDGTQPANADTALSGNTLLAELVMNATAFAAASNGVLTANAITQDSSANASGTATFYRLFKSDGTTALWDDNVATSSAGLVMATTTITAGQIVGVDSLIYTIPKS